MNYKFPLSSLFLSMIVLPLMAESDDMGLGVTLEAEKEFSKEWSASLEGEYRTQGFLDNTERWSIGVGSAYTPVKWLKFDAGYLLLAKRKGREVKSSGKSYYPGYWSPQHRIYGGATYDWKINKHFTLSLRERYQFSLRPELEIDELNLTKSKYAVGEKIATKVKAEEQEHLLRSRLQLKWKPKDKGAWSFYTNVEALNLLDSGFDLDQMRYSIGGGYKLTKCQSISLDYRYKDRTDAEEAGGHLVTFGYKISF